MLVIYVNSNATNFDKFIDFDLGVKRKAAQDRRLRGWALLCGVLVSLDSLH
jgi:hypothetical protein